MNTPNPYVYYGKPTTMQQVVVRNARRKRQRELDAIRDRREENDKATRTN